MGWLCVSLGLERRDLDRSFLRDDRLSRDVEARLSACFVTGCATRNDGPLPSRVRNHESQGGESNHGASYGDFEFLVVATCCVECIAAIEL